MIYKKIIVLLVIVTLILSFLSGCQIDLEVGLDHKIIETNTIGKENNDFWIGIKEVEKTLDDFMEKLKDVEDQTEINELLAMFKSKSNLTVACAYFANELGQFYTHPTVEMPEDYDARTRQWYIQAMKGEIYISEIYLDAGTGDQIITIAKKMTVDDEIFGVVGIDIIIDNKLFGK